MDNINATRAYYIHPNLKLLSHSSSQLLHSCPRKYQLIKLSPQLEKEKSIHFDFGHLIGTGLQEYFITASIEKTYWKLFNLWKDDLEDERGEKQKKTFYYALHAIDMFAGIRKSRFGNYELAYINGQPAVELGFSIDLGNGFAYRGFVDLVLIDRIRREIVVIECKSTGAYNVHEAMYKNSGQALGYSVVLDRIAPLLDIELGSSWKVIYPIYLSKAVEWKDFVFPKNQTSRARWLKQALLDKSYIEERCADDSFFPMHGESCYSWGRECEFFGTCELDNKFFPGDLSKIEEKQEDMSKYAFKFTIEELIEEQMKRVSNASA